MPEAFLRGLSTARLSGRAQIVHDSSLDMSGVNISSSGDLIFYLDGAHSPESMEACAKWYSTAVKENNNNSSFSPSCSKFLTMEGVWGNGRANHENNESNKIFKQVFKWTFYAISTILVNIYLYGSSCQRSISLYYFHSSIVCCLDETSVFVSQFSCLYNADTVVQLHGCERSPNSSSNPR